MKRRTLDRRPATGFTLIEAMTAIAIVLIACSAMLLSVTQAMQASQSCLETSRANMLAEDMMREISACRYSDPTQPNHWGPEANETASNTRQDFDDIDDYDRWSRVAQTRAGITFDTIQQKYFPHVESHDYSAYTVAVEVIAVPPPGPAASPQANNSYRMIKVRVLHPKHPTQELIRIFYNAEPLLGKSHWYDPNATEPPASTVISALPTLGLP